VRSRGERSGGSRVRIRGAWERVRGSIGVNNEYQGGDEEEGGKGGGGGEGADEGP